MHSQVTSADRNPESMSSQVVTTSTLLRCGLAAGPLFLLIFATQILLRPEFRFTRDEPSLLSIGPLGWIQIGNRMLGGLLVIAGARGIRRLLRRSKAGFWGPLLLQVFGICEVGLGIFVVDPARSPASMTLHGTLHIVFGAIGFLTLMAACFVFARSFHVQKKKAWAIFCRMVGLMFLAAFLSAGRTARLGQDTSSIQLFLNLVFCLEWIWVSSISLRYYQQHLSDPSARETLAQTSGKFGRSASSRDDTTAGRN